MRCRLLFVGGPMNHWIPNTQAKRCLVLACSARKLNRPATALDIYQGAIFRKGVEYARTHNLLPFVLSAKLGLIAWDTMVEPYNQKMQACQHYRGPWPQLPGFYLGGQLYFRHAPEHLQPLVPATKMGFMLANLNRLLAGEPRSNLF